jgi:hypothetical protein
MKQVRLRMHMRINAMDTFLDNTLFPIIMGLALFAYLWDTFK